MESDKGDAMFNRYTPHAIIALAGLVAVLGWEVLKWII